MEAEPQNFSEALKSQLAQALNESNGEGSGGSSPAPAVVSPATPPQAIQVEPQSTPHRDPVQDDPRLQKIIAQAQQTRAEREAFKREQENLKADLAELARYRELKARAKDDPVAVAETFGYKPDEYATQLLDKGSFSPERRRILEAEQRAAKLEERLNKFEQEQAQAKQMAVYSNTVDALKNFAQQEGDRFDLIRRTGDYNRVIQKFHDHYQRTALLGTPEELPWEQAFEQAEDELLTQYSPVLESPKIRSKFGAPASQSASLPAQATRPSGSINLKSRNSSAPPRELSEAESLEKAGRVLFRQFGVPQ